jgi:hypothetical protein
MGSASRPKMRITTLGSVADFVGCSGSAGFGTRTKFVKVGASGSEAVKLDRGQLDRDKDHPNPSARTDKAVKNICKGC